MGTHTSETPQRDTSETTPAKRDSATQFPYVDIAVRALPQTLSQGNGKSKLRPSPQIMMIIPKEEFIAKVNPNGYT